MPRLIEDRGLDALRIEWSARSPGKPRPVVLGGPPELRILRDFLSRETWQSFARFILPGALNHHGRIAEDCGFRFRSDLDPDEEPFEGVELFDPIDTIYISEAAFDRLMSRHFDVIVQGVAANQRPELDEPWWPGFATSARALATRAQGQSPQAVADTVDQVASDLLGPGSCG